MADPIAQKSPELLRQQLLKKYSQFGNVPTQIVSPVAQIDLDRVRRGLAPLGKSDTQLALASQLSPQPIIQKAPDRSPFALFNNAVKDVEAIGQSIPHLPGAILNEFQHLPEGVGQFTEGLGSMDLNKMFTAPGFRMLPGSFLAANGPGALLEHPIFSAMDVIPAIKGGVGLLSDEAVVGAEGAARAEAVKLAMREKLGSWSDRFGLGPQSAGTARNVAQWSRRLTEQYREHAAQVADITKGMSADDIANVTRAAQSGNPEHIASLAPEHQAAVGQIRAQTEKLNQWGIDAGLLGQFDNEIYPIRQAQRLDKLRMKYYDALGEGNVKAADKWLKKFGDYNTSTPPLRFQGQLGNILEDRVGQLAASQNPEISAEGWAGVQKLVQGRFYDQIPNVTTKDLSGLADDVAPVWQAMKEAGHDPVFIHAVSGETANRLAFPHVNPFAEVPVSSAKARTWNMAPGMTNFAVGLDRQAMEYLLNSHNSASFNELADTFGKTKKNLIDQYMPIAEQLSGRGGYNLNSRVNDFISRDWVKHGDDLYLPRAVDKAVQVMAKPRGELAKLWDAGMGAFRVGILPLSPRWHLYNVLGGAMLLAGRTGPEVLKYAEDAVKMVKNGEMPEAISHGMGTVPAELRSWQAEDGAKIASLVKDSWVKDAVRKGVEPARHLIQKSYDFNEFIDSMYRSMAYLYGKDKALTKGMTAAEAKEAGIQLSNKILQDWDAMTPIERSVIRGIFPFYGWAKHITKYVMTYPWDHPLRASIVSNIARNELADEKSGLPTQFRNYLFFGSPDQYGNQTALNVRGANPFADVANYFTLAGFVGQMNPMFQGLMTAMGFNPRTGSASLFPNMVYDEETGRMKAATKNPFVTIAEGLSPQASGIASLIGADPTDLKTLALNNPQAYRARLLSSFGLPGLPKEINKGVEKARATLAQKQVMQADLNNAIKTGDYGSVSKYPQLRPVVARLKQLDKSGALDQFKIQQAGSPTFDIKNLIQSLHGGESP